MQALDLWTKAQNDLRLFASRLSLFRHQQFISSCRSNTSSKNCKDRCICLFISVGLISLVLHLKYVIPISSSTLDPSCLPLPQLLGAVWNWFLYGILVVQFCERHPY